MVYYVQFKINRDPLISDLECLQVRKYNYKPTKYFKQRNKH